MQDKFVVGPVINQLAVDKVTALVNGAIPCGATLRLGDGLDKKGRLFFQPTILCDLEDSFDIHNTEIFGPVLAIYCFTGEEEVIHRANNTEYDLVTYAWTTNLSRAFRLSRKLESGMAIMNSGSPGTATVPFGGIKHSGYGREGRH